MKKKILCLVVAIICLITCFALLPHLNGGDKDVVVPCETVSLDKTNLTLSVGESASISANVSPSDTTDKTLAWSSTDPTVAIYENGEIKALRAGYTVITATAANDKNAECSVIVIDGVKIVDVNSVSFNKENITLNVGESETLVPTVLPANATDKTLNWVSSDPSVATVADGVIGAVGEGSASITAVSVNGKVATCTVTVSLRSEVIAVESIILNKTSISLNVEESDLIIATVVPEEATDKMLVWTSSNENVATVNNGMVSAVGEGSAVITVSSNNGKVATCTVNVITPDVDIPAESVALNRESLSLNIDESYTLVSTVAPENATNKTVTWSSSNPAAVTVHDGVLEAVGEGTAEITATTINGKTAVCTVTVTRPVVDIEVEDITLDKTELSIDIGSSETLVATITPGDATDQTITWVSSDTSVATVSNGVVTALGNGTATITATTANGKSASCTVTAQMPIISVSGVVLDKQNIDIYVNEKATLLSVVSPSNAAYKGVVWSSSDSAVVTVNGGEIFGINPGTATVSVTTNDGGFVASCEVTVKRGSIIYTLAADSSSYVVTGYSGYDREIEIPYIYGGLRVVEIGKDAFRGAKTLESVIIPNSVVKIGDCAFYGCSLLKEVLIPDSVNYIGEYAFGYCDALSELTVMGQLSSIGSYAFCECVNLEKIYYNSSTTTCTANNKDIFYNAGVNGNGITLTLSKGAVVPEGLFEPIDKSNAPKLTSIIAEQGALSVGYFAEKNYLPYLSSITLPDTVADINYGIFNNSLWWSLQDSGLVYINNVLYGYKDKDASESVTVRDDTVCIASGAFSDANTVSSLTVPYFGKTAADEQNFYLGYLFGAENAQTQGEFISGTLKNVKISSIKTELPSYTFYGCSSLESIVIPDTVVTIGEHAFFGCSSLKTIDLSRDLVNIGNYAFYGCSAITSVFIPANVREIGLDAFSGLPLLSSITVSSDNDIYHSNSSNAIIRTKDKTLVLGCAKTSVPSDGSVTVIASHAFHSAYTLTEVVVPDSVEMIESAAFYGCKALESVSLPFVGDGTGSYTNFGYVFGADDYTDNSEYVPSSVKRVVITGGTSIASYAFYGCDGIDSITVSGDVTSIGEYAFGKCSALKVISIPDSAQNIHPDAFYGCTSLTYNEDNYAKYLGNESNLYVVLVKIKDTAVTSFDVHPGTRIIWESAFEYCTSLARVNIYSNVKQIGDRAFAGCSSLESVTVPSSVTSIGDSVFYGCSSLKSITLPFVGSATESYTNFGYIFGTNDYISNVYYLPSSLRTVVITGGTSIADYAFYGCDGIESITLPNSVTGIGDYAFYFCSSLKSMTIPSGVTEIGSYTFYSCSGMESIAIRDGVESIGDYAFYGCLALQSVEIPSSVTSIGNYAFYGCPSLESITLPFVGNGTESYTNFGYIFGANSYISNRSYVPYSLKTVVITGGTSIADYAFYGCSNIQSIIIPDSATSVGIYAFYGCSSLDAIEIPNSVTSIGSYAFYDCSSLESITLPFVGSGTESYTNFGYIFGAGGYSSNGNYVPSSLKRVEITGVTSIADYAFYGCSNIQSIAVSDSVTSIGESAFYGCSAIITRK